MADIITAPEVRDLPAFQVVPPSDTIKPEKLPDGTPMSGPDALLVPQARSFSMILNAATKIFSYRADEALRNSQVQARAMRRDAFLEGLFQERYLPTVNRRWQLAVDDDRDPAQIEVRDGLTRNIQAIRNFDAFRTALLDGIWFGRAGTAWSYARNPDLDGMWSVPRWDSVHGDSVQFTFEGTPAILMDTMTAGWYSQRDRSAVRSTDRGGFALVLSKPYWRDRYAIHQHLLRKADFFDGELAGSVQGLGLRGLVYWHYVVRTDALTWMLRYMQAVGMMDLLVFNYPTGDAAAKLQQEKNANQIIGKAAIVCPRPANGNWPAVEQLKMNSEGLKALHDLVSDYFDRHIERLFVGQSMSAGADNKSGLGGTGRAELARATKDEILAFDTNRLDETLTYDLVGPLKRYNYPWARFPVRFKSILPNIEGEKKVASGKTLVSMGVSIKTDELREAAGYSRPEAGDETIGGPGTAGMGGEPGSDPNSPLHVAMPGGPNPGGEVGQPSPLAGPPGPGPANPTQPPSEQVDREAADWLASLFTDIGRATGVPVRPDPTAILVAIRAKRGGVGYGEDFPTYYAPGTWRPDPNHPETAAINTATGERVAGWAAKSILKGLTGGVAPTTGQPRQEQPRQTQSHPHSPNQPTTPTADQDFETLTALAHEFPETTQPGVARRLRRVAGQVRDVINNALIHAAPYILPVAEMVLDTPRDVAQFGFRPALAGVGGPSGDAIQNQIGISTHLFVKLVSLFGSKAITAARQRLRGTTQEQYDGAGGVGAGMGFPGGGNTFIPGFGRDHEEAQQIGFTRYEKPTAAVDLDGTLLTYHGWKGPDHFGTPRPGAADFLRSLQKTHRILIFTTRTKTDRHRDDGGRWVDGHAAKDSANKVCEWLDKHGLVHDEVYTGQGKPIADCYIDDRAITVPQNPNPEDYAVALIAVRSRAAASQYGRTQSPFVYTNHAPAGGITIGGKPFTGGEFIPGDVMEKASPEERAAVEGHPPASPTSPDRPATSTPSPTQTGSWDDRHSAREDRREFAKTAAKTIYDAPYKVDPTHFPNDEDPDGPAKLDAALRNYVSSQTTAISQTREALAAAGADEKDLAKFDRLAGSHLKGIEKSAAKMTKTYEKLQATQTALALAEADKDEEPPPEPEEPDEIPEPEEPTEPDEPEEPTAPDQPEEPVSVLEGEPNPDDYENGRDDESYKSDVQEWDKYNAELDQFVKDENQYKDDYKKFEELHASWKKDHDAWEKSVEKIQADHAAAVAGVTQQNEKNKAVYTKAFDKWEKEVEKIDGRNEKRESRREKAQEAYNKAKESDDESFDEFINNYGEVTEDLPKAVTGISDSIAARLDAEESADPEPEQPSEDDSSTPDISEETGQIR